MKKITSVTYEMIQFSDGSAITYNHKQDGNEENYADFEQLCKFAFNYEFEDKLIFKVDGNGFKFGDKNKKFFIPCYSWQCCDYYSDEIEIYYNGKRVAKLHAEIEEY